MNVPEWAESVDAKTGKAYYYNRITKQTRWDRPPEMDEGAFVAASSSQVHPSQSPALSVPQEESEWIKTTDPSSGI